MRTSFVRTSFTILSLLLGPSVALPLAAASGGPTMAHFIEDGIVGTGVQNATLVVGYDSSGTPEAITRVDPNQMGYIQLNFTPHASLVPAAGRASMVLGVDACATADENTDAAPACVPLDDQCPAFTGAPTPVPALVYCPSVAGGSILIDLGLGWSWSGALRVHTSLKQQPAVGVLLSKVRLSSPNWDAPSATVDVAFTTVAAPPAPPQPPAPAPRIAVVTDPACPATMAPAEALRVGESKQLFAVALDERGACGAPVLVAWGVTGGIGRLSTRGPSTSSVFTATTPGQGRVHADDLAGHDADSVPIGVATGKALTIRIVNDTRDEVGDLSLDADSRVRLFALGFDSEGALVGPVVAAWSVVGGCGVVTAPTGFATELDAQRVDTTGCRVVADAEGIQDATGVISVAHGNPRNLTIRHQGALVAPQSPVLMTGASYALDATYTDADNNAFAAPDIINWAVEGGCGALSAERGATVRFQPLAEGTACRVRASAVADLPAPDPASDAPQSVSVLAAWTGSLTIVDQATLAHLLLRTQPDNGGVAVHELTLPADASLALCAAGYDRDLRYIGDIAATWTRAPANGTLAASGGCATYTPSPLGEVVVKATSGAIEASATITVVPGEPVALRIVNATTRLPQSLAGVASGTRIGLAAQLLDAGGHDAGSDAGALWRLAGTCGSLSSEAGATTAFTASYVGGAGCTLRLSGTRIDGQTIPVSVTQPALASIRINAAADDAAAFAPSTARTSDRVELYAAGYDAAGHFLRPVAATWALVGSNGTLTATSGEHVTFDPDHLGLQSFNASFSAKNATAGPLTIVAGPVARVAIETAADGTGAPAETIAVAQGASRDVYAVGRDGDAQFVGLLHVNWSLDAPCRAPGAVSGCPGAIDAASGPSTRFTATQAGSATLTAQTAGGLVDTLGFTVNASNIARVAIELAATPTAPGAPLDTLALTTDQTATLCARGFTAGDDAASPPSARGQGYVAVNWSVASSSAGNGTFTPATGSCTTFDPRVVGTGSIVANYGSEGVARLDSIAIDVRAGKLVGFVFRTPPPDPYAPGTAWTTLVDPADADGNLAAYAGRLAFSSTDANATLPPTKDLTPASTPADRTFSFTLKTNGTQSVFVNDTATFTAVVPVENAFATASGMRAPVLGANVTTRVSTGALASFGPTIPVQVAGVPFAVVLEARDAQNNLMRGYAGAKTIASSCQGVFPATPQSVTFTDGVATATMNVTNTTSCAIGVAGEADSTRRSVTLNANALHHFTIDPIASDQTAGIAFPLTLRARDEYGNTRTHAAQAVTITNLTGATPAAGGSGSLAGGVGTISVRMDVASTRPFDTTGQEKLNVTAGSVITGTPLFRVNPDVANHYAIAVTAATQQVAGTSFVVNVSVHDAKHNVRWQSGTAAPVLKTGTGVTIENVTTAAWNGYTRQLAWINKTGSYTLDAQSLGGANEAATGAVRLVTIVAAPAAKLAATAVIGTQTAGAPFALSLRAQDAFDNVDTTHVLAGTLTSNCSLASPAALTFAAGVASPNVNLTRAGTTCWLAAASGALTPFNQTFIVQPDAPRNFTVDLVGGVAGAPVVLNVTDIDAYGNNVTFGPRVFTGSRTVVFAGLKAWDNTTAKSEDGQEFGNLSTLAFVNGVALTHVTLYRAGAQNVTVTEPAGANALLPRNGTSRDAVLVSGVATRVGILAKNATTATRNDVLASESFDGQSHPFHAKRGVPVTFHAAGFDAWDNIVGWVRADWTDTGPSVGQSGATGASSYTRAYGNVIVGPTPAAYPQLVRVDRAGLEGSPLTVLVEDP